MQMRRSPARLISVDPMLDELAALLVATRPVAAQAPGCLSPEGQVLLWDPGSTSTAPQCTADHESPPSSPVQGTSPQMAGTVAPTEDDSPTPREATRRLARFREEVLVMRQPPHISPLPSRSRRQSRPCPLGAGGLLLSRWATSQRPNAAKYCS
jgi:hypothetical protein